MGFLTRHLQRLGVAALHLVSAELAEVSNELGKTRRLATRNLIDWAIVFALAFWFIGALSFAAIAGLSLVLAPWASALVVSGVYLFGAVVMSLVARSRMQSLESPMSTVRRRIDGHVEFWRDELDALVPTRKPPGETRVKQDIERPRATDAERREAREEEERRRVAWGEGRESGDFDDIPDQRW